MAGENSLSGTQRVRGELLKLGIIVSARSIRRYRRPRHSPPPSQSWRTFLSNHAQGICAPDLLGVQTLTFKGHVIHNNQPSAAGVVITSLFSSLSKGAPLEERSTDHDSVAVTIPSPLERAAVRLTGTGYGNGLGAVDDRAGDSPFGNAAPAGRPGGPGRLCSKRWRVCRTWTVGCRCIQPARPRSRGETSLRPSWRPPTLPPRGLDGAQVLGDLFLSPRREPVGGPKFVPGFAPTGVGLGVFRAMEASHEDHDRDRRR